MIRLRTHARRQREARTQVRLMAGLELHARSAILGALHHVATLASKSFRDFGTIHMAPLMATHQRELAFVLTRVYRSASSVFAARVRASPKGVKAAGEGFEDNSESAISAWIRQWTATKVKQISETTGEQIAAIVNAHENEDITSGEMADLIEAEIGGTNAASRAATIARTETHSAAQYGSMAAAESLGIPNLQKIWVATSDDRTRDDHADADGQSVPINDTFTVGEDELEFPGDPSGSAEEIINCRCAMVYDDKETE